MAGEFGMERPTEVTARDTAMAVYAKPRVVDFGTLRDLTRIGCGPDYDGGIFGIADGRLRTCFRTS
jgi:hypothetical protein